MKFGPVPVSQAGGAILAHSLALKPRRIAKGTRLEATHLQAIAAAGIKQIVVARLQPGDIGEDEAAARLAGAVCGAGLRAGPAFTGRVNLFARQAGVVSVDAQAVTRLNQVSQSLTLATVKPFDVVAAGQLVATVKIIPFAVASDTLEAAITACGGAACLSLARFSKPSIGLVVTRGAKPSLLKKASQVTARRVEAMGGKIVSQIDCDHDAGAVAGALRQLSRQACDPIIVFSSFANVDIADEVPSGLVLAGGEIIHFGMPVDPGNLLLLGRLDGATVIGAPGCAKSPARNGFDWVLARVMAGQVLTGRDIAGLGVGGLLKEIPSRPQPREAVARVEKNHPGSGRIAAVILAAGASRRMGATNKLTQKLGGKAMVRQVAQAALGSRAHPVIVVTGHQAGQVEAALAGLDVRLVHNSGHGDGLASSLAAGIGALSGDTNGEIDGALVMLGDMPHIGPGHLDKLIGAFDPDAGHAIVTPTNAGKRGNPVLWGHRFFGALTGLTGDVGAKHLIGENQDWVVEVELDGATLVDIDTPKALSAARRAMGD